MRKNKTILSPYEVKYTLTKDELTNKRNPMIPFCAAKIGNNHDNNQHMYALLYEIVVFIIKVKEARRSDV